MEEEKVTKQTLSPIKTEVWLLLREYCQRKTREYGRLVTMGETIEKAIMNLVSKDFKIDKKI